jgi:hypothetical protein
MIFPPAWRDAGRYQAHLRALGAADRAGDETPLPALGGPVARRLDFDDEEDNEEHTPAAAAAGDGWPVSNGVPVYRGLAAGAAAPPSPVGTPPGSPGPLRPQWRTGSCGESGPFIGLSYGWTCELARRMDRWPGVDAFDLKQQMFAELAEEPDLLRDFTEQEVVDGMAHYSWPAERTREMLAGLRAQRAAAAAGAPAEVPWHRDPAWMASQWR